MLTNYYVKNFSLKLPISFYESQCFLCIPKNKNKKKFHPSLKFFSTAGLESPKFAETNYLRLWDLIVEKFVQGASTASRFIISLFKPLVYAKDRFMTIIFHKNVSPPGQR